ncbi:MAG: hypothetical protein IT562_13715 [Alphaproteobacteria bacterium]|nr:hypothetical protein [Alphaproteobacteria bacterium]
MRKQLEAFANKLISTRLFGAILAGLILAFVLAVVVGSLGGQFSIDFKNLSFSAKNSQFDILVMSIFFTGFFAFSFLFYFITYKEREDILSPLRKKLVGTWKITYQSWSYSESGRLVEDSRHDACTIGIDEGTAKLYISINIDAHKIYEDGKRRIDDITLNPLLNPKRLTYYHLFEMKIKEQISQAIGVKNSDISFSVFCWLKIIEPEGDDPIQEMEGRWYDLDGTISNIRMDLAKKGDNIASLSAQYPLSGTLTFRRQS